MVFVELLPTTMFEGAMFFRRGSRIRPKIISDDGVNCTTPRATRIVIYEPSAGRRCSRMSAFFLNTIDEGASAFN
jgi:hypothetical protein